VGKDKKIKGKAIPLSRDSLWLYPSKDPPLAEKVIMQDLTPKIL